MKKDNVVFLQDILDCIAKIGKYLKDVDYKKFSQDDLLQDAIFRNFEVIGEATTRLSDDFLEKHPEFPAHKAKGMRNWIIHGYEQVKLPVIFKTANEDLPELEKQIKKIINP